MRKILQIAVLTALMVGLLGTVLHAQTVVSGRVSEGGQCQSIIRLDVPLYSAKPNYPLLIEVTYIEGHWEEFEVWTDANGEYSLDTTQLTGRPRRVTVECTLGVKTSTDLPLVANFHCP